jgi:hypothetical protein
MQYSLRTVRAPLGRQFHELCIALDDAVREELLKATSYISGQQTLHNRGQWWTFVTKRFESTAPSELKSCNAQKTRPAEQVCVE